MTNQIPNHDAAQVEWRENYGTITLEKASSSLLRPFVGFDRASMSSCFDLTSPRTGVVKRFYMVSSRNEERGYPKTLDFVSDDGFVVSITELGGDK